MNKDEQWMEIAIQEAKKAKQEGELPFGAVLVCDDKEVVRNHSREKALANVTAHAELQAVHDACKALSSTDLSNCTIYCSNEPCIMCSAAIFQADIPRVVIGASRDDLSHLLRPRKLRIEELADDSSYTPEIIRGVLKDKVIELFAGVSRK